LVKDLAGGFVVLLEKRPTGSRSVLFEPKVEWAAVETFAMNG
jgi:hypothetical protein